MKDTTPGALCIRDAAKRYGVSKDRIAGLVARREVRADTSRRGRIEIPVGDLEAYFFGQPQADLARLKEELMAGLEGLVKRAVKDAFLEMGSRR